MQTKHSASLALTAVSHIYGDNVAAVRNVSVKITAGEFLTILGPSGSGKSTTLAIIGGLVQPSSGDVWINDRKVTAVAAYKRNLGFVFQDYALFPHMTVYENVAYPLRARRAGSGEIETRVARILGLVKLGGLERRKPSQLSGGQQQRVALARALVFDPPVVLMDEPLGALDKQLRKDMQLEIRALQQQLGITAVYVTHDQEEALSISDRIAVMNNGIIEQIGSPRDLYDEPQSRFVGQFIGEMNCLDAVIEEVANEHWTARTRSGITFQGHQRISLSRATSVVIGVRPERIRLAPGSGGSDRLKACAEEVAYVGEWKRYRLRVGEEHLWCKVPNLDSSPNLSCGDVVDIWWGPDDARVLEIRE